MHLWVIAAVAAYFIKGLCGFANTLVLTSILSFGAANANISPIDLLRAIPPIRSSPGKTGDGWTQRSGSRWRRWGCLRA